jgi:hypothetical protein
MVKEHGSLLCVPFLYSVLLYLSWHFKSTGPTVFRSLVDPMYSYSLQQKYKVLLHGNLIHFKCP